MAEAELCPRCSASTRIKSPQLPEALFGWVWDICLLSLFLLSGEGFCALPPSLVLAVSPRRSRSDHVMGCDSLIPAGKLMSPEHLAHPSPPQPAPHHAAHPGHAPRASGAFRVTAACGNLCSCRCPESRGRGEMPPDGWKPPPVSPEQLLLFSHLPSWQKGVGSWGEGGWCWKHFAMSCVFH